MKFTKPGDLLAASKKPHMKRAVMKAIGMPMPAPKKRKSSKKMADSSMMAMKTAKKGTMGFVKGVKSNDHMTTRRKGSLALVKNPKNTKLHKKSAVSGKGFGDEKLQDLKLEHSREQMNGVKKGAKRRKGSNALVVNPRNTSMPSKKAKKA